MLEISAHFKLGAKEPDTKLSVKPFRGRWNAVERGCVVEGGGVGAAPVPS